MKTLAATFVLLFVASVALCGADIDGKWKSERTMERNGQSVTITMVFDLKSEGTKLTGTVTSTTPRGERKTDITDGKIEGNKFSFTVSFDTPNGAITTKYEGTIDGAVMKGTSVREGGQGEPRPFEAKKQ